MQFSSHLGHSRISLAGNVNLSVVSIKMVADSMPMKNIVKRSGPSTDPCGTRHGTLIFG